MSGRGRRVRRGSRRADRPSRRTRARRRPSSSTPRRRTRARASARSTAREAPRHGPVCPDAAVRRRTVGAPALLRHGLAPPDLVADESRAFDARRRCGDCGGGERRWPGPVRDRRRHASTVRRNSSTGAVETEGHTQDAARSVRYREAIVPGRRVLEDPGKERQPSPAPARDDNAPSASRQSARSAADRPPSFRSEKHDMSIDLSAPPVPFSFEVYPPRSEASTAALHETIRQLAAAGSALHLRHLRRRRLDRRALARPAAIHPARDRRCRRSRTSPASAAPTRQRTRSSGSSWMPASRASSRCGAIRPPAPPRTSSFLGDLESAAQLVQLIDRVQAERAPYTEAADPRGPGRGARRATRQGRHRGRGVPERAPAVAASASSTSTRSSRSRPPARRSPSRSSSSTPTTTSRSSSAAREAGVTIPILPGIMPITSPRAAAPRARAERRGAARRARDRARRRADGRGAAATSASPTPRRSPARSSRAARPACTSTRSTTTTPCSRSSATPALLTHPIQKEAVR